MVKAYKVLKYDKVLLIGEGNFTFSRDFVLLNNIGHGSSSSDSELKVVSTCREGPADNFSALKEESLRFIVEKEKVSDDGVISKTRYTKVTYELLQTSSSVKVVFNVDATNLKNCPEIVNRKFTKIIFNFPHVGGKMKIHLNRKLLKDFFSSTVEVLESRGCVVVALCDGQGGTPADKTQRRWDDTWQITEMAAHSDFVLREVEPFNVASFPQYVNVGFRSQDKSFHCENAVVHVFVKLDLPRILLGDPYKCIRSENLSEDLMFDVLEEKLGNPFFNESSAIMYMFNLLTAKFQSFNIHSDVLQYKAHDISNEASGIQETFDKLLGIFNKLKGLYNNNNIVSKVLMKKQQIILSDFSTSPVKWQMVLFTEEEILPILIESVLAIFVSVDSGYQLKNIAVESNLILGRTLLSNLNSSNFSSDIIDTFLLPNKISCHVIHLDNLTEVLFKTTDWRSLWSGEVKFSSCGLPRFFPVSLFPKSYEFDISLSVPSSFKQIFFDKFFLVLWLLAGDMIVKTEHISSYFPTDRDLLCYCYRITYKSPNAPLFRKRVIKIHEEIVAKYICQCLQVSLR